VAGAGPAGSRTALALARRGQRVAVVDYRTRLGDKLCTGIVGVECAERFGVEPDLILHTASSATVVIPSGKHVQVDRGGPQAHVIDRVAFVARQAELAATAGAEYMVGLRIVGVERLSQGVIVTCEEPSGRRRALSARSLVVATGLESPVPRMSGFAPATQRAFAAQVELHGCDVEGVRVYLGHGMPRGHFGWVVPAGPGRALAGVLGRGNGRESMNALRRALQMDGVSWAATGEDSAWGVPLRPAEKTYGERVLMVGDAAGQVKPTTGGGIYYSMLCGEVAGEVLAEALDADELGELRLSEYERRWKELLGRELRVGSVARSIFERLDGRSLGILVELGASNGLLRSSVSFDWHADLLTRALGYRLFDAVLSPFRATVSALSGAGRGSGE